MTRAATVVRSNDQWMRSPCEMGFVEAPYGRLDVALNLTYLNRGLSSFPPTLLADGTGWIPPFDDGNWRPHPYDLPNWGGAILATGPLPGYPLGRILHAGPRHENRRPQRDRRSWRPFRLRPPRRKGPPPPR